MIKYVKSNLESIFKIFINHVGMTIFALVVLLSTKLISSKMDSNIVFILAGILTVLMYFSLTYTAMWERGARDKIKIDGGREKRCLFHGLYIYLIANAIGIISSLVALIFFFFSTPEASAVNSIYAVFKFISHYWYAIYMSITSIEGIHTVIYVAVLIPGALVSTVSYILGVKGFKCIFPEPKYDRNRKIR
ncbi:MAG: hypothetical protein J6B29_02745 [Clostridia bacterium]|nr:hypothetical protein [Clostridia bacterium]